MAFWLTLCVLVVAVAALDRKSPRLITEEGNLIIKPGLGKNITLDMNGRGSCVLVGQINVLPMLTSLQTTINKLSRKKIDFESLDEIIPQIQELLYNNTKLYEAIHTLENSMTPGTGLKKRFPSMITRKIRKLENSVNLISRLLPIDDCVTNPCEHGGTCIDAYNKFQCLCPKGWEGPDCSVDENECEILQGTDLGCQNGATCINRIGTFECVCPPMYVGVRCTLSSLQCSLGSNEEICGHGTCVPLLTSIMCLCEQGWKNNGVDKACNVDVDECTQKQHPCSVTPFVPCINSPGSFSCGSCPSGYTGNGHYCSDIDECQNNNGGCSTVPMVQCLNTLGSRTCGNCPPGYEGNGITCTYKGLCQINNGGCNSQATCSSNPSISATFVQCSCNPGYTGSGYGLFGCTVSTNDTTEQNRSLLPRVHCYPNLCVYGICHNTFTGYICICHAHYTGPKCDNLRDPCNPQPCRNGGSCINDTQTMGYRCDCKSGYTGRVCQNPIQACGGVRVGESGSIVYPPVNITYYKPNIRCAWVIKTTADKILNITFTKFNVEASRECTFDWLQIHDGQNTANRLIGRYCGTNLPNGGNILSTQNYVYMWFSSDHSVSMPGFSLIYNSTMPICGEEFVNVTHGGIKSPGSPGLYPPNRDCYWGIIAPVGKRIQFHFFTMQIEPSPDCSKDFLAIYEELNMELPIVRFCNTSHPQPLLTPGNVAKLYFHSDDQQNGFGFQLTFVIVEGIPGCGGTFTTDKGEISPPSYDGKYLQNIICHYKIQQPIDSLIKITFSSFELESSSSCRFDYLSVYDGDTTEDNLIGSFCGDKIPDPIVSSSNKLLIVFKSDWSLTRGGFKIRFELDCHKIFSENSGQVKSIGYPKAYPASRHCSYLIKLPPKTAVKLSFVDFDLEGNNYPLCFFDNLKIYDGENNQATKIATYCGKTMPPTFISTHNYLFMEFNSDSSVHGTGFLINYTSINLACGGILKDMNGIIESPIIDDEFDFDKCVWILSAPSGYTIQTNWMTFNLQKSSLCYNEYIELFENNTALQKSESLGKYCGNTKPPSLTSLTNTITIIFHTIVETNEWSGGFSMSYGFIDSRKVCGGTYLSSTGVITSPGWPMIYLGSKDCTWTIRAMSGHQIMLNFTEFDLENSHECNADYLEIRSGDFHLAPVIGKFCGKKITSPIPSLTNSMILQFHSDMTTVGRGFRMTWQSTSTDCGGILEGQKGTILSPNYPQPYGHNSECYWKVTTSAGSILEIVFTDIDLESSQKCWFDYVEVFDSVDSETGLIGRYCRQTNSQIHIRSSSNHVYIKFRSDSSRNGRGFIINYNTICNLNLHGFGGVIESPNFPSRYPSYSDCNWNISVPTGNKINITFSHFDIDSHLVSYSIGVVETSHVLYKDYDRLEIDDSENKPVIYYGTIMPKRYTSTSNKTLIHFFSDRYLEKSGFRLEWTLFGCGGKIKRPKGELTSPGFPNKFAYDVQCDWHIQVEEGSSVQITIINFEATSSAPCSTGALVVFNGRDDQAQSLFYTCKQQVHTQIFTSSTNNAYIRFIAEKTIGRRLNVTFDSVPAECGGKFSGVNGVITSPNYPMNYKTIGLCYWYITVPELHRVNFTFLDYDLNNIFDCFDYIKVYEGDTPSNVTLLQKFCNLSSTPNQSVISTSNKMLVEFAVTSFGETAKGFKASYSMICGMNIETNSEGIISFNSETLHTTGLTDCTWTIVGTDQGARVSLTFTYMDLLSDSENVNNTKCGQEYTEVYNGKSITAPVMGRYCGNKVPHTLVSNGNALTIMLRPRHYYGTFSAFYSVLETACGGNLTSENGAFTSPFYPDSYPLNMECFWTFIVAPGNQIKISFTKFDIEVSENCDSDYLEIRENDESGKLIGTFCENIPDDSISGKNLWIKFHSDEEGTASGFVADFSYVQDYDISGQVSGSIASPLYPMPYRREGVFHWRILVNLNERISITFVQFSATDIDLNGACTHRLSIYDGFDEKSKQVLNTCGVIKPDPIESTSNIMYIELKTGNGRMGTVFLLNWNTIDYDNFDNEEEIKNQTCGSSVIKFVDKKIEKITSPGYPGKYENNLMCSWIYETQPYNHLILSFQTMNLEADSTCFMDKVRVYSGNSHSNIWTKIGDYCMSSIIGQLIETTSNKMKIEFITDSTTTKTGFEGTINAGCGSEIKESSGIIKPTFLMFNWHRINCTWKIQVKTGRTIKAKFTNFNISNSEFNCSNYVMLRDGISHDSPILGQGKYCGRDYFLSIPSTSGNHLYAKMQLMDIRSPISTLEFNEESYQCDENIVLGHENPTIEISSPNYPNIPNPHTQCTWTVMVPAGERLKIDFIDRFDLTESEGCQDEFIEIRDGGTEFSDFIGRYCSDKKPPTVKTTGNIGYINFATNINDPKNGFKANLSIDICGGTLYASQGKIDSPYFLQLFSASEDIECLWNIITLKDHTFAITANLEWISNSCENASVEIFDIIPSNETEIPIGKLCELNSGTYRSMSSHIGVRLKGKKQVLKKTNFRFTMTYNASKEKCGGSYNSPEGIISTQYDILTDVISMYCEWRITVPDGRRVTLEILEPIEKLGVSRFGYYNDFKFGSPIQRNYNDTFIESTRNVMLVTFWTMRSKIFKSRFKARYTSEKPTICGSRDLEASGQILPPSKQIAYNCEYSRRRPSGARKNSTFVLIFSKLFMQPPIPLRIGFHFFNKCLRTTSRIFVYSDNEIIGTLCNTLKKPEIITSSADETSIMISSNNIPMNYTIDYYTVECGGPISISDVIVLNLPENNLGPINCKWTLPSTFGNILEITAPNLTFTSDCESEYLKVYEMNQRLFTVPNIKEVFCSDSPFTKTLNVTWKTGIFEYHSRGPTNATKLVLSVNVKSKGCGGEVRWTKMLKSPNYPKKYENNQECMWIIKVALGYSIQLEFKERFFIETSQNCTKDFVEIFDHIDSKTVSLGRYCGRTMNKVFKSTSNTMSVLFRSDSKITGDGFKAIWSSKCGGKYEAKEEPQRLISPGSTSWNDLSYDRNLNCKYQIAIPYGKRMQITFSKFRLENGRGGLCKFDNLTIWQPDSFSDDVKVFCGITSPGVLVYNDFDVTIVFQSDNWIQYTGFLLTFALESCGGKINTTGTEIISDMSPVNVKCNWNITAPLDKVIVVKFEKYTFDARYNFFTCDQYSITAYEGSSISDNKKIAVICGNLANPPLIKSTTNNLYLVINNLNSDLQITKYHAKVLFVKACSHDIRVNSTAIEFKTSETPTYESFLECEWVVLSPVDTVIQFKFIDFHVAQCYNTTNTTIKNNCSCDYLEIRDGIAHYSSLIDTYCGHLVPPTIVSSGNQMYIRFVTDGTVSSTGVKGIISTLPSICGTTRLNVSKNLQTFKSPIDTSGNVLKGLRCNWFIKNSVFSGIYKIHIRIKFIDLDPAINDKCVTDKLEISNPSKVDKSESLSHYIISNQIAYDYGGNAFQNIKYIFCGNITNYDLYTSKSTIKITLDTSIDSQVKHKGFEVEFSYTKCSRNYTQNNGRILIDSNDHSTECVTRIKVDSNRTISLYVKKLAHFPETSVVNVRDGGTETAPLLLTLANFNNIQSILPLFSSGNKMTIFFKYKEATSLSTEFDATYTSSTHGMGCGGQLHNNIGIIYSPLYPRPYRGKNPCVWELETPKGTFLTLKYGVFDIGPTNCEDDYLELQDRNSEVIMRHCPNANPAPYRASSNFIKIVYRASTNNGGSGWMLEFKARLYFDEISEFDRIV